MMRLGVSSGVIKDELAACRKILEEWERDVAEGIPGVDKGGEPEVTADFMRNFFGEILYVSDKLASLVTRTIVDE